MRRLDLKNGRWLSDLELPDAGDPVGVVLLNANRIVVLTAPPDPGSFPKPGQDSFYRVTCFPKGGGRHLWSRRFSSAGALPSPGAFLLSQSGPASVGADVTPLTWLGDDLLVCAGPMDDIALLEGNKGKDRWRVPRIWEFQRGFVGPSVWSHYIGRFGIDEFDRSMKRLEEARAAFRRRYQCSIVGGPVVLMNTRPRAMPPARQGQKDGSIFVAVARGPAEKWSSVLSDSSVYELDGDGKPVSIVNVPRMIQGWQMQLQPDGVVWGCQNQAMVKVAPVASPEFTFSPGGPDHVGLVTWYREYPAPSVKPWLSAEKAVDPIAFTPTHAFRCPAGGYLQSRKESVYRFPISEIDRRTGMERTLTLNVPFQGKVPVPTTNYRGGPDGMHTWGPYLLGLTRLELRRGRLRVTLGMEYWNGSVEFDLRRLEWL